MELNKGLLQNIHSGNVAAELSSDGVLGFDRECRYTAWNATMQSISGLSADKVVGRGAYQLFPFLKQAGEDRLFTETLRGNHCKSQRVLYSIAETGRYGFFDGAYSPVMNEQFEVVGGIAIIRDVTSRVVNEEFSERSREFETPDDLDDHILSRHILKALGKSVAQRRKLMEMSQEEVAFRASLHRTYITDVERGARNISMLTLAKIARALELHPWILLAHAEKELPGSTV